MARFDSVAMAGGGCRCFWLGGFWEEAAPRLGLSPSQYATVSASNVISCGTVAGVTRRALEVMKRETALNPRNAYPRNLLKGQPVFPQLRIYERMLREVFDAAALERVRAGPEIRVLLARPPAPLPPLAGMAAGILAYQVDKQLRRQVHPTLPARVGFRPEVVDARTCRSPAELVTLILASSCTLPITTPFEWAGRVALDGGMVDNVPVRALREAPGQALVLLTRRYRTLPVVAGRVYVQPSQPVPVRNWDYTRPDLLQETWDLGRRDGEAFARKFAAP